MVRWIESILLYMLCHHFLKSYTISWVSIWLITRHVVCYSRFKASYVLSFVKLNVFVCIIRHQNVNRCFPFDAMNAINYVYIGVPSFLLNCHRGLFHSHMVLNCLSCDFNWYNTIVSWQYLSDDLTMQICGLLFTVSHIC